MIDKPPESPSHAEGNGRDPKGRFGKGNKAGKGNPHLRRVRQLTSALLREVSPEDIAAVIRSMIDAAKGGDPAAAKVVLERTLGKVTEKIEVDGGLSGGNVVFYMPESSRNNGKQ